MIAAQMAAESYWFDHLTLNERIHYERCVHSIIAYYNSDIPKLTWFTGYALQEFGHINLVRAIVWRIHEELYND
jgi:hypothetical protein